MHLKNARPGWDLWLYALWNVDQHCLGSLRLIPPLSPKPQEYTWFCVAKAFFFDSANHIWLHWSSFNCTESPERLLICVIRVSTKSKWVDKCDKNMVMSPGQVKTALKYRSITHSVLCIPIYPHFIGKSKNICILHSDVTNGSLKPMWLSKHHSKKLDISSKNWTSAF